MNQVGSYVYSLDALFAMVLDSSFLVVVRKQHSRA